MNKSFNRLFTFYFSLFTVSFLVVSSARAENPANMLDKFLSDLETYSAAFEQVILDESGEELETSIGVFYLQRPGMFHWAYIEPYSQIIISDSLTLWIYEEDLEQVVINEMSNQIEDSPAAIFSGDVKVNEHYVVLELEPEGDVSWLELTPRDLDSEYESIRLGFRGEHLVKMLLFDNLGQQNRITFLDTKRNIPLDIDLFRFTPPEGTDIIDNRE